MVDFEENVKQIELPQTKNHFTDREAGFGVLLFVAIQLVVIWIARLLVNVLNVPYTSVFSEILSFVIEAVFVLSVYLISLRGKKNFIKCVGLDKKVNGKMVGLCIFIAAVCLFGLSQVSNVFIEILTAMGYHSSASSISVTTFWQLLLYTFLVALVPAVCEEIMFRGLLLNGLARCGKHLAIILSALIFTLMHGSPDQTVHQFILGIVFGYIVYFTGNLYLTIIIHFTNNFAVLVVNFVYNLINGAAATSAESISETASMSVVATIFSVIISLVIVAIAVYLLITEIRRLSVLSNHSNGAPQYLTEDEIAKLNLNAAMAGTNKEAQEVKNESGEILVASNLSEKKDKQPLDKRAIVYLVCSIIYLGVDWILALINGFLG